MAAALKPEQNESDLSLISRTEGVYTPLPTHEPHIRLLEIQPGESDSLVQCTLTIHRIDHASPYSAISYEWGDAPPKVTIKINELSVDIGINCQYVLWQVRSLDLAKFYWIDALCINQEDLEEKGSQVQKMGTIYETAEQVLACLGPQSDDTFDLFEKVKDLTLAMGVSRYKSALDVYSAWMNAQSSKEIMNFFTTAIKFTQRSYWARLWIVQEIIVARKVLIVCGLETLEWFHLSPIVTQDFAHALSRFFPYLPEESVVGLGSTYDILTRSVLGSLTGDPENKAFVEDGKLEYLLEHYGGQLCANPLDRVYGFVHLLNRQRQPYERVVPDYTKSTLSLAVQCLGLLYAEMNVVAAWNAYGRFFKAVENLAQALRVNAQQSELHHLVQLRQQRYSNLASPDAIWSDTSLRTCKHNAMRIASAGTGRSDDYIVFQFSAMVLPVLKRHNHSDFVSDWSAQKAACGGNRGVNQQQLQRTISRMGLRPRFLMSGRNNKEAVGMLCEYAEAGDYFVRFDIAIGNQDGSSFSPYLIVRRCEATRLFEIVGQGLLPWGSADYHINPTPPGQPSKLKFYFDREDLLVFTLTDPVDHGVDEDGPHESLLSRDRRFTGGTCGPLHLQRLCTAVTKSPFSSFAVEEEPVDGESV